MTSPGRCVVTGTGRWSRAWCWVGCAGVRILGLRMGGSAGRAAAGVHRRSKGGHQRLIPSVGDRFFSTVAAYLETNSATGVAHGSGVRGVERTPAGRPVYPRPGWMRSSTVPRARAGLDRATCHQLRRLSDSVCGGRDGVEIGGDVSGQISVGVGIHQQQYATTASVPVTADERRERRPRSTSYGRESHNCHPLPRARRPRSRPAQRSRRAVNAEQPDLNTINTSAPG